MPAGSTRLWWRAPATRWFGANPIGNGRLGGMVFGRVYKETLQINEETLWTRLPDRSNADARRFLPEVRALLLAGRTEEAHSLAELTMFGLPNSQSAYQQLANVTLLFGGHHEELVSDYRRELDLERGVVTVSYNRSGTASPSAASSSRAAPTTSSWFTSREVLREPGPSSFGTHVHRKFDGRVECREGEQRLSGRCGAHGTSFEAALRVIADGGTARDRR